MKTNLNNVTEVYATLQTHNTDADCTTSNATVELKLAESATDVGSGCFAEWSLWHGSTVCPMCGSAHIEVNNSVILTTYPAQSQLRCKVCGYLFSSGFSSYGTQSSTPPERNTLEKSDQVGWVCSKCGRSWAPHVDGCKHCNSSSISW